MSANKRQAYDIVAGNLSAIGYHLELAKEGEFGYFMEAASLIGLVSFDPNDWFEKSDHLFEHPVYYTDLPVHDRYDIGVALQALSNSTNEWEFRKWSLWCKKLGKVMDARYLETFLGPMSET